MIARTEVDGRPPAGDQVLLYGADWCADCRRTKSWLRRNEIPFTEYDTDADDALRAQAEELAGGRSNIPVVVTPEGAVLVEPTNVELATTLRGHRRRHAGSAGCR
jgi:glutaredoxin